MNALHPMVREEVRVGPLGLPGLLAWEARPRGMVVFVHGSGSSRFSPRNRQVAEVMHGQRLGTLLMDLLTEDEGDDRRLVFDIDLLAQRVATALEWLGSQDAFAALKIGLFGASTGAAAALQAAAAQPGRVAAVVSRGGRPDLAASHLADVRAPTLLIVGAADTEVLQLNRQAMRQLHCQKRLENVPGATHLFEEPGALEAVAHLACAWFSTHLSDTRMQ
jgi:putative phosphoribosyl transferase